DDLSRPADFQAMRLFAQVLQSKGLRNSRKAFPPGPTVIQPLRRINTRQQRSCFQLTPHFAGVWPLMRACIAAAV
ncbi:hypothetical protein, partial [Mesorhizobium sp. M7A.F.Ca.CA.004.06.2.1]|uniref:hypothetical protein n=1 Tax=Mesorhizobium sp. M7A.F.Ca.CA.004.06.2.1 TaxID=2496687 RepID=UPI0019D08037